ncbi:sigma-54 interaction domain-containing protein [Desulfobacterota bacterium M19]
MTTTPANKNNNHELHKSRAEVQRLVKNWRSLLDIMPIMVLCIRNDKVIEYLNQSARKTFGNVRGQTCATALCSNNCQKQCPMNMPADSHDTIETRIADMHVECTTVPFAGYNGDNLTMVLLRDISKRKQQENELKSFNENIDHILRLKIDELKESEILRNKLARQVNLLKQKVEIKQNNGGIIGSSRKIRELLDTIQQVAATDAIVLITGESGTGKELVADLVRRNSQRHDKIFLKVNCSAINENLLESDLFGYEKGAFTGAAMRTKGKFEIADGGTIFLDEIGDISPRMQSALLRILQSGELIRVGGTTPIKVDVRIIAATNVDLAKAVEEGAFRLDLYYRLNIIRISLPPLRERKEDIMELTTHFVKKYRQVFNKQIDFLPHRIIDLLLQHDWPGNVRELDNVIQRTVLMSKSNMITENDIIFENVTGTTSSNTPLTDYVATNSGKSLKDIMSALERDLLTHVLHKNKGNVVEAAKQLAIGKTAFYDKLKRHGLSPKSLKKRM